MTEHEFLQDLETKFHAADVAYFKKLSKVYGDSARRSFKRYNEANSVYRMRIAQGFDPIMLKGLAEQVQLDLFEYHEYSRLCAEAGLRALHC